MAVFRLLSFLLVGTRCCYWCFGLVTHCLKRVGEILFALFRSRQIFDSSVGFDVCLGRFRLAILLYGFFVFVGQTFRLGYCGVLDTLSTWLLVFLLFLCCCAIFVNSRYWDWFFWSYVGGCLLALLMWVWGRLSVSTYVDLSTFPHVLV